MYLKEMFFGNFTCRLFYSVTFAVLNSSLLKSKIINGVPVLGKTKRYVVSIQIFRMHICGGCVISQKHILTTANCIYYLHMRSRETWNNVTVLAGTTDLLLEGCRYNIEFALINPLYDPNNYIGSSDYDIGVFLVC